MTLILHLIVLVTMDISPVTYSKPSAFRDPFNPVHYLACLSDKHLPDSLKLHGVIGGLYEWKGWFHSTEYGWFSMNVGETLPLRNWMLIKQTLSTALFIYTGEQNKQCQLLPLTLKLTN